MNKTVKLPAALFARLQKLAIPLEDTTVSVIERLVDQHEALDLKSKERADSTFHPDHSMRLNPLDPPDFSHSVVVGTFGERPFKNWNDLVQSAHIETLTKVGGFKALKEVTLANIEKGNHRRDCGFKYLPKIGISIQGVDSRRAWQCALHLAKSTGTTLRAKVTWRVNEKAEFPGETGVIEWKP
jgi:hypothetical protein